VRVYLSLILLAVLVVLWMFDWWHLVKGKPTETVSAVLLDWSAHWPVLPFLMGMVMGHLLWPQR